MANGEYKQRVSDIISVEDMESWTADNLIVISAGTDSGKSYFIKNMLYEYARAQGKKILFLLHRVNCQSQFQMEIVQDKKTDTIDIRTYQSIDKRLLNTRKSIDFSQYAYIVCDEFHYFISDAEFNPTTDLSFYEILKQRDCIRIYMSATGEDVEKYLELDKKYKNKIRKYELSADYSHVSSLTFFQRTEDMDFLAERFIENGEKAIFFIQSAQKAYKLFKKFSKNSLFNCSAKSPLYRHVDNEKIDNMLKNERFEENILFTTSCFDAGANIVDRGLKYIVADIKDVGSLIQCLGRKRSVDKDDTVSFYIKNISNQQLGGFLTKTKRQIEMANYLLKHNTQELIMKYPREIDRSGIIYDDINLNRQINTATKKVNGLMYAKKRFNIEFYAELMKEPYGYCKYISSYLQQPQYDLFTKDYSLLAYLQRYVDENRVMLSVKDRKPLIDKLDIRSDGKQLKSIESLNAALIERELPYKIVQFMTHRVIDGQKKKFKHAWKVKRTKPPD